jgi:hypothetical protein
VVGQRLFHHHSRSNCSPTKEPETDQQIEGICLPMINLLQLLQVQSGREYPNVGLMRDDSTLASSAIQYPEENGRRYHAYRAGRYSAPNDEVRFEF